LCIPVVAASAEADAKAMFPKFFVHILYKGILTHFKVLDTYSYDAYTSMPSIDTQTHTHPYMSYHGIHMYITIRWWFFFLRLAISMYLYPLVYLVLNVG